MFLGGHNNSVLLVSWKIRQSPVQGDVHLTFFFVLIAGSSTTLVLLGVLPLHMAWAATTLRMEGESVCLWESRQTEKGCGPQFDADECAHKHGK